MLRLTRLTQGKAYLLIARYRFRVPIPSEGEEFRESEEQRHPKGVSSVVRGLVGHRSDGRGDDPRGRCANDGEQSSCTMSGTHSLRASIRTSLLTSHSRRR